MNKKCKLKDCSLKASARGFCRKHYSAYFKGHILLDGTITDKYKPKVIYRVCRFPRCGKKPHARGFCSLHRKWVMRGYMDEDLNVLDQDWFQARNYHMVFNEKLNKDVPMPRNCCRLVGCKNKDLKGQGLCEYHYSRYVNKAIDYYGNRLVKPKIRYREDFPCNICGKRPKDGAKIIKGLCKSHYSMYKKGNIDYNGTILKNRTPNKGHRCRFPTCRAEARSMGFCTKHYYRYQQGMIDINGRKIKDLKIVRNKGKPCRVEGCDNPSHCRRLCRKHYSYLKHHGTLEEWKKNIGECSEEGCNKPAAVRTLCHAHYFHLRRAEKGYKPREMINKGKICSEIDCDKPAHCKGKCRPHYEKMIKKKTTVLHHKEGVALPNLL